MKNNYQYAIIGGGLAGLYMGYKLSQQGIDDYIILDANDHFGGRIKSFQNEGFDLGATWFWPEFQPELSRLIDELGLERFEQYEQGNMLIERSSNEPPKAVRGYLSAPTSNRLIGGMASLIKVLLARQKSSALYTNHAVSHITLQENRVRLTLATSGQLNNILAEKVLLALPPRLASTLHFSPKLPDELQQKWHKTATWMAPHAKYIAVYASPFWREQGLSGYAHSQHGPLSEIHDISMPTGKGALFGFLGVPANFRQRIDPELLKAHCRQQLVRLYGEQASEPIAEIVKDWAQDPLTATEMDYNPNIHHSIAPKNQAKSGEWQGKLWGIASEWSPNFGGYLAGAIESVEIVFPQLLKANN